MKKKFLLLIAGLTAIAAAAQEPMDFEECLREASQYNPDLYTARQGVKVARANLLASYSPFLPQISAGGGASRNNQELDTGYQLTTSYRAGVSVDQNIFNGFQDVARLNQKRQQFTQAEINLQRIKSDLSAEIRQAFFMLVYAQDDLILSENILSRRKDNFALVEIRFESGTEDKGSLLRSKALRSQAAQDVTESKRQINVAQCNLNKALGRQERGQVVVTGSWKNIKSTPLTAPDFQEMVNATPEYRQADAQCAIAQEQIRIARSGFLPTWSVSADYGLNDDDSIIPRNESWSVGTVIGISIFSGGKNIYALRSAHASLRVTKSQLISSANSILLNLEEKFTSWENAVERVRLQVELLEAAETRMEIANIKYSNGLMTFQDWDTIGNDLITTQKNMLSRELNAIITRAEWEKTAGISIVQ